MAPVAPNLEYLEYGEEEDDLFGSDNDTSAGLALPTHNTAPPIPSGSSVGLSTSIGCPPIASSSSRGRPLTSFSTGPARADRNTTTNGGALASSSRASHDVGSTSAIGSKKGKERAEQGMVVPMTVDIQQRMNELRAKKRYRREYGEVRLRGVVSLRSACMSGESPVVLSFMDLGSVSELISSRQEQLDEDMGCGRNGVFAHCGVYQ